MVLLEGEHALLRRPLPVHPGRDEMGQFVEESRYLESSDPRRPPMPLERAMREACQLPGTSYFVAAVQQSGEIVCLSAPVGHTPLDQQRFFSEEAFLRELDRTQNGNSQTVEESVLGIKTETSGVPTTVTRFNNRGGPRKRQSITAQVSVPRSIITPQVSIIISDNPAIWRFYDQRFKDLQQYACKTIAKAWIKAVEPKKQSTHPYTGGEATRPGWWPPRWGPGKNQMVIHREPDHISKSARLHLLVWILRLVVEPIERQHPDIRKSNLSVQRLEEVSWEALGGWFNDSESPSNMAKRPFLKELFKVAFKEERYKHGEIDGLTEVFVMAETGDRRGQVSRLAGIQDVDSDDDDMPTPSDSPVTSPATVHSILAVSSQLQTDDQMVIDYPNSSSAERDGQYHNLSFGMELTSSSPASGSKLMVHPTNSHHGQFGVPDMYHGPHRTERRSPFFQSPSSYEAYPQWQASTTINPPVCVFGDHNSNSQACFGEQVPRAPYLETFNALVPQPQGYMGRNDSHHGPVHGMEQHPDYPEECDETQIKSEGLPLHPSGPQ
ncbi:hypothetical protein F5Y16DRAFT_295624 [Xylariaceae sp. FL0255]|nr:hypothetical protein F5Y16DRAFT_295624 [Xylariaceae sp. FL0255]